MLVGISLALILVSLGFVKIYGIHAGIVALCVNTLIAVIGSTMIRRRPENVLEQLSDRQR